MGDNKDLMKECARMVFAVFVLLTVLTGCGKQEAQFLEENLEEEEQKDQEADADVQAMVPSVTPQPEVSEIYVDVCGAVKNPGVYCLETGSRVFQAIEAAGGYLPKAAQGYLNRAKSLEDGQMVYVPTKEEARAATEKLPLAGENTLQENAGEQGQASVPDGGKVNINTADESALTSLAGIGPSKARAILSYREANGPFGSPEDLMNVEGIKEGTFSKIKDKIAVE